MERNGTQPRRPSTSVVPTPPRLLLVRRRVVDLQRVSTCLCRG